MFGKTTVVRIKGEDKLLSVFCIGYCKHGVRVWVTEDGRCVTCCGIGTYAYLYNPEKDGAIRFGN